MTSGQAQDIIEEYRSLEDLVQKCTGEDGILVDVFKVARTLKFKIEYIPEENSVDLGYLQANEKGRERTMYLNENLPVARQRALISYMIAESIVMPELMIAPRKIQVTVFTLRAFREMRFSRSMLLATRFAFSEQAINQLSELQNQKTMELCIRHAEREFANATIRGQSIEFLLNNQII